MDLRLRDIETVYIEGGYVEITGVDTDEVLSNFSFDDIMKYFGIDAIKDFMGIE